MSDPRPRSLSPINVRKDAAKRLHGEGSSSGNPKSKQRRSIERPPARFDFKVKAAPSDITSARDALSFKVKFFIDDHQITWDFLRPVPRTTAGRQAVLDDIKKRTTRADIIDALSGPDGPAQQWRATLEDPKEDLDDKQVIGEFVRTCAAAGISVTAQIFEEEQPKTMIFLELVRASHDQDWTWWEPHNAPLPEAASSRHFEGLDGDLRGWVLSFSPATLATTRWPSLTLCLAAVPVTGSEDDLPSLDDLDGYEVRCATKDEKLRDGHGKGVVVPATDELHQQLRASYAAKALLAAQLSPNPRQYLETRVIDPSFPPYQPSPNRPFGRYGFQLTYGGIRFLSLSSPDKEEARAWTTSIEATIVDVVREEGWLFVRSDAGAKEVAVRWLAKQMEIDLEELGEDALLTRQELETLARELDADSLTSFCLGRPRTHPPRQRFTREELLGRFCLVHYHISLVASLHIFRSALKVTRRNMIDYDKQRGIVSVVDQCLDEWQTIPRSLLPTQSIEDLAAISASLKAVLPLPPDDHAAAIAKIVEAVPGSFKATILSLKPRASRAPPLLEAVKITQSRRESLDLVHQYAVWPGGNGKPTGHNLMSCMINTKFFNMARFSGLPLLTAFWYIAVSITAAGAEGYRSTLNTLELLFIVLQGLNTKWRRAGCKDEAPLTDEDIALAQEAHAILVGDATHGAPLLKAKLATAQLPAANIKHCIKSYKAHTLEDALKHADDQDVEAVRHIFDAELKEISTMSEVRLKKWSDCFAAIAAAWNPAYDKNIMETPTLLWAGEDARHLFIMAWEAAYRGVFSCDAKNIAEIGKEGGKDLWAKAMVSMIQYTTRWGRRDAPSSLRFNADGQSFDPLAPTLLAKICHLRPLWSPDLLKLDLLRENFDKAAWERGCNATMQSRATNTAISSERISVIFANIDDARPAVTVWLQCLKALGIIDESEQKIKAVEDRPEALAAEIVELLRDNGVQYWEV